MGEATGISGVRAGSTPAAGRRRVGILVFDDVEVLDVCGPFEVFSTARLGEGDAGGLYRAFLIGEGSPAGGGVVRARGGLRLVADEGRGFDREGAWDVLIVPGGLGARREVGNAALLDWLRDHGARAGVLASVCTGALLLAKAGFLAGGRATTHRGALDWLRREHPDVEVVETERVVRGPDRRGDGGGPVFTSGGVAAGIDLALDIVARHHGEAAARATADYIEYPYREGRGAGGME